LLEGI